MKRLIALLLALTLLCGLAGCSKQQTGRRPDNDGPGSTTRPEPPRAPDVSRPEADEPAEPGSTGTALPEDELGFWNGDVYSSAALNLNFTLPEGWEHASDEELLEMVDAATDNDLLSDDAKAAAGLAKSRMVYAMIAQDPISGTNVQLMFMDLGGLSNLDFVTEESLAEIVIAQQETAFDESSGATFRADATYRAALGGEDFLVLPLTMTMSGAEGREWIYLRLLDDKLAMIAITALDGSDPETMEGGASAFTPLEAGAPGRSGASGAPAATGDIGRTFSTMFFDYTVVSAESPAEYDGYTPAEGNRLLVLRVRVKNDFGSTLPMYDTDFQLQWGPGDYDYAWAVDAFNDEMMPLEWELADGREATYDMLFEAPAGQNDFSLVYLEEYTDADGNDQTGEFFSADFTLPAPAAA